MNKTLFEKLTGVPEDFTLQQSVTENIGRILRCGGFLDADTAVDLGRATIKRIFGHGLPSVVDVSQGNEEQQAIYRKGLAELLLRFEPRLKSVTVKRISPLGSHSKCQLKIVLADGEFEQEFVFGQI